MGRIGRVSLLLVIGVVLAGTCLAVGTPAPPDRLPVSIKGMRFHPETLAIKVGQRVRWTNEDDRDHTVVAADNSFKSGNLRSGAMFEHRFDKPGRFAYSCSYHPRMKGTVIVSE
jgi:plastocyanin